MSKKIETVDAASSVVEVQSKSLFDRVSDYLTEKELRYSSNVDNDLLSFEYRLRDGAIRVMVEIKEGVGWSRILAYSIYSTFVPEHRRVAVVEALSRINYRSVFGNFEMDLNDGEVRVRTVLEGDSFIGEPMIDRAIGRNLEIADQYQAALLAIAFGNASPKEILEMASQSNGAILQ